VAEITLKAGAGRRFLHGHPWVFSNELEKPEPRPEPGEIVTLRGPRGQFCAHGFYHPHSLIAFRSLSRDEAVYPEAALFASRLDRAIMLRERLYPQRSGVRLVHSESDGLPGLIVDRYADVLAVQVNAAGMEREIERLLGLLAERVGPRLIVLRNDSALRDLEGLPRYVRAWPADSDSVEATINEHGLEYRVDVLHGQKTGFFLDQHANRLALRDYIAAGDRVLDAFCNDGGFALNAAAAGAASVLAVDSSAAALARAAGNAATNGLADRIDWQRADIMHWLPALEGEHFDVVILDPPGFANNRKAVPAALKAYRKLHEAAFRVLKPGGFMATACCSHHVDEESFVDSIRQAAGRAGREVQIVHHAGHGADHPVLLAMPESRYLKYFILRGL